MTGGCSKVIPPVEIEATFANGHAMRVPSKLSKIQEGLLVAGFGFMRMNSSSKEQGEFGGAAQLCSSSC
jgi:hypothetical protein